MRRLPGMRVALVLGSIVAAAGTGAADGCTIPLTHRAGAAAVEARSSFASRIMRMLCAAR